MEIKKTDMIIYLFRCSLKYAPNYPITNQSASQGGGIIFKEKKMFDPINYQIDRHLEREERNNAPLVAEKYVTGTFAVCPYCQQYTQIDDFLAGLETCENCDKDFVTE